MRGYSIMNRTLVVNYQGMKYGGIENFIIKLIRHCIQNKYRVVWITTRSAYKSANYKEILYDDSVEKCFISKKFRRLSLFRIPDIHFTKDEAVTMISFEPLSYLGIDRCRKKISAGSFNHLFIIPHFTGSIYFPERNFKNIMRKWAFRIMQKTARTMMDNNAVYAFNKRQLCTYLDNYQYTYKSSDIENLIVKSVSNGDSLEVESLKSKAKRRSNEFEIISCLRFDLPHKGYIIGLIKAFSSLYSSYPHIKLTIVGFGEGENKILKTISNCSDNCRKAIELTGPLSTEELERRYRSAAMVIGVAGSASLGAKNSTVTIPVRHYTYECEGYGFYSDNSDRTLSEDTGTPIEVFIRRVIEMNDAEYVKQCMMERNEFERINPSDPDFVFQAKNSENYIYPGLHEQIAHRVINWISVLKYLIFKEKVTD